MYSITIRKLNLNHELMWSYTGHVLERTSNAIVLEAHFNRADSDAGYVVFERGDRFVEHFYTDRWYNIFAVFSAKHGHFKGWYCNIAQPAVFIDAAIEQVDLALDVWIKPDGSHLLLDEDEFHDLPLDAETRRQARLAVEQLLALVQQQAAPFNLIRPELRR